MPTPGPYTFFSDHDDWKLTEWVKVHTCGTIYRHRFSEDPAAYIREHIAEGCRVWRRDTGKLIGGPGFDPDARLRQERR